MFTLAITDKHGSIVDEGTFEEGEILVGRSQAADVVLPSDNVSRKHARIYTVDGRCYVEDLRSSNGVFVNGRRIHEAFEIEGSAQIKVGDYYILIEGAGVDDGVFGRMEGHNLAFANETYELTERVTLVGRGKDCGLTFVDGSISRAHAKLTVDPSGSVILEDLNSSNGTFVNDEPIQVSTLSSGDSIRFGNAEFTFTLPQTVTSREHTQGWGRPPRKSRKGLWITISILVVLLATGAVLMAVFADDLFGSDKKKDPDPASATLESQEARALQEQLEAAEKKKVGKLKEQGNKDIEDRRWQAAANTWGKIEKLVAGDKEVGDKLNFIRQAEKHEKYLAQAKEHVGANKPGEAAELLRKKIIRSRLVTPYVADAKKMLEELRSEQMQHKIAQYEAVRGNSCARLKQRLAIYETILKIDPDHKPTRDAKSSDANRKRKLRGCQ